MEKKNLALIVGISTLAIGTLVYGINRYINHYFEGIKEAVDVMLKENPEILNHVEFDKKPETKSETRSAVFEYNAGSSYENGRK